jgi:PAS domain S-box-containing protein
MQESAIEFRTIVLLSLGAILITDTAGKIEFMNPAAKSLLNRRLGDALGLPLVDGQSTEIEIFRPEKGAGIGSMQVTEIECLKKKAFLITIHDITRCKLLESQATRFEKIIEISSSAVGMFTPEGNCYYQNKAFSTLFEGSNPNFFHSLFVDENAGNIVLQNCIAGDECFGEFEMHGKGTEIVNIIIQAFSIKDKDNKIEGFIGIFTDITEIKKALETKRLSDKKIRALFDATYQFIGMMTPEGILIEANKTALKFAGIQESDCLGKLFWETPWWTHSKELQNKLREATKKSSEGKIVFLEATHVSSDGRVHYIDFSLKPVLDENGKVLFLIPEGRDITDSKNLEASLNEQIHDLNVLLDVSLEREEKMIELKETIRNLEEKLREKG